MLIDEGKSSLVACLQKWLYPFLPFLEAYASMHWFFHSSAWGGTSFPPFDIGWPLPVIKGSRSDMWLHSLNFKRPCSFPSHPFAALRLPREEGQAHLLGDGPQGEGERQPSALRPRHVTETTWGQSVPNPPTNWQQAQWRHLVRPAEVTPLSSAHIAELRINCYFKPLSFGIGNWYILPDYWSQDSGAKSSKINFLF